MRNFLSRRHPRYIRSLVYMLQASEYNIFDFLKWHERTNNFRNVEKRKQLVFTPKATILFVFGWFAAALGITGAILLLLYLASPWNYIVLAITLVELPLIVSTSLIGAVFAIRAVQWPIEGFLLARARKRLRAHKGIKIAIAGSFGKTSMREILKAVLSEAKKVAAPKDSHNTPLAIAKFVQDLKGDEDVLIFELGEYYPGDVRKLAKVIRPQWGVITGLNEAHFEKFKTLDRTANTIFELAEFVEATHLYINGENERVRARWKSGNTMYTREGVGSWDVSNPASDLRGTRFTMSNGIGTFKATSKLLGLHMIGPLAMSADIAMKLGLTVAHIEKGIEKTKPFAHRLEPRQWGDDVTLLDDSYNGNPDGAAAAIAFLTSLPGRRFYVTPGLVEAGSRVQEVHENIGRNLSQAHIEKVVLIRNSVTPYIELGLKSAGFKGEIMWYDDMPTCLAALQALILPGDIVLIQNDWPDQYA